MKFTIVNAEQRSPEWFAARAGRLTSSCVNAIFMQGKTKGSESVTKRDLRIRLALEQMTGRSQDGGDYRSDAMQYGVEREPDARLAYEAHVGQLLREAGFLSHNELLIGASPDGYLGEFEGGAEFKCPKTATHLDYLRTPGVPADYLPQMRHHLLVTGAEWWDFVSFDDRLPEPLQLVVRRLLARDAELPAHELAVRAFLTEIEREKAAIEALALATSGAAA
jgi:hypothetical protein